MTVNPTSWDKSVKTCFKNNFATRFDTNLVSRRAPEPENRYCYFLTKASIDIFLF